MYAVGQVEWGEASALEVFEKARPNPAPTEVLVRVAGAGVNPVDIYTRKGVAYNRVLKLPFVNGWDIAGVVEETGYGVTRFKPGDRVFGMPRFPREAGAYAEYVTAPSRQLAPIPEGVTMVEAAAVPLAGLTAWQMLVDTAGLEAGQHVLVSAAAGGVGHLAVQLAKARGAYVTATASTGKHDFVRQLGADEVIDYTSVDLTRSLRDVDVVMQMFGGEDALRALSFLRRGGIMVNAQGAWTPGMAQRAAGLGVRATDFLVEPDGAGMQALAELIGRGQLRVRVARQFALEDASSAHEFVATGRTAGKVVLVMDDQIVTDHEASAASSSSR